MAVPTIDGENSYASTANATSHTIPLPTTGMASGKLLVALIETGGGETTTVTCSGWTVVGNGEPLWNTSGAVTLRLAWKYAGASESNPVFDTGAAGNLPMAVYIAVIGGVHPTAAIEATAAEDNDDTTANFSVIVPSVTTLGPDRLLLRAAAKADGTDTTWDANSTEIMELVTSGTIRSFTIAKANQTTAGSTPTSTATSTGSTGRQFGGFIVAIANPTTGPPPQELVPDTIAAQSGGAVAAVVADLQEDPTVAGDTDGLVPADPTGQSGLTNGPEYVDGPASATAWTGGTGATWGTYANVIDASDTTSSTVTLSATNTDYQNFFSFAAADWSDLPATAIITGVEVRVRSSVGTANRLQHHIALATANGTLLGAEKNVADNAAGSTTTLPVSTNTEKVVNAFSVMPTRAQLVTGTFGVRFRQRRSNTVTITVFAITMIVTYRVPGSTTNTTLRVTFPTPTAAPDPNTTDKLRARVGPRGTKDAGASDPQARITLYEAGATKSVDSGLVTITADGTIEVDFDPSVLTTASGANVEAYIEGLGVAGQAISIYSVRWYSTPTQGPSGVNIALNRLNLAAVAQDIAVAPGQRDIPLNQLALAAQVRDLTVAPGVRQIVLNLLNAQAQARDLTVAPGVRNIALNQLNLAAQARDLVVAPGVRNIPLNLLSLAALSQDISVAPGTRQIALNALGASVGVLPLNVAPGGVTVPLNSLSVAVVARDVAIAQMIPVDVLNVGTLLHSINVQPGTRQIGLNALGVATQVQDVTVIALAPARMIELDMLGVATQVRDIVVAPGTRQVALDRLGLATSLPGISVVPGPVAVPLTLLGVAVTPRDLAVAPGSIAVALDRLTLAVQSRDVAVQPGTRMVTLNQLGLTTQLRDLGAVVPGQRMIALDRLDLLIQARTMLVGGEIIVELSTLSMGIQHRPLTVQPGPVVIPLDQQYIDTSLQSIGVVPGAVNVQLNRLDMVAELLDIGTETSVTIALEALGMGIQLPDTVVQPGEVVLDLDLMELNLGAPDVEIVGATLTINERRVTIVRRELRTQDVWAESRVSDATSEVRYSDVPGEATVSDVEKEDRYE